MYIQAQGITPAIQNAVFACLRSWVRAGEIIAGALLETPLFQLSFDALHSDGLFDVAVDVLCDIINETQEVEENMPAIQLIVQRLLPLRADLSKAIADDDEDKVRGLCRLYVAAGETYHQLVLKHKADFFPIVEAIAQCAAYTDVEIVQITFRFWYMLATGLGKARGSDPEIKPFLDVFERIYELVIGLLRWPDHALSSSDTADHRELRHHLGDTLKDCGHVLGAQECLARSLHMIEELLARGNAAGDGGAGPKWQDIEAPLFSMRAMGRAADMHDNSVTPRIMDIVGALPDHPKVKYAGLLVVCRYTEWVAAHPERIPGILSYVSSGLQGAQIEDTGAAAAQAMNFLCMDCARVSGCASVCVGSADTLACRSAAPRSVPSAAVRLLPRRVGQRTASAGLVPPHRRPGVRRGCHAHCRSARYGTAYFETAPRVARCLCRQWGEGQGGAAEGLW